jgi:hypothetical protein
MFDNKFQKYLFDFLILKMVKTHFWKKLKNEAFS